MIRTCWLTINRACNLRCKWCYSFDNGYSAKNNASNELICQILDICQEGKINSVVLIGGEPTISPSFLFAVQEAKKRSIRTCLTTNGLRFLDQEFLDECVTAGLDSVNVSLKSFEEESYFENTGFRRYHDTLFALSSLTKTPMAVSASIVLTKQNLLDLDKMVKDLLKSGVQHFSFSFCHYFNESEKENRQFLLDNNPYELIGLLQKQIPILESLLTHGESFAFQMGFPRCIYDAGFIDEMERKHHISESCQLLERSGILFDTDGTLIPCNHLYGIPLGKLNVDFASFPELENFLKTPSVVKKYRILCGVPDPMCFSCSDRHHCGGGCVIDWTNYTFHQLQNDLRKKASNDH